MRRSPRRPIMHRIENSENGGLVEMFPLFPFKPYYSMYEVLLSLLVAYDTRGA